MKNKIFSKIKLVALAVVASMQFGLSAHAATEYWNPYPDTIPSTAELAAEFQEKYSNVVTLSPDGTGWTLDYGAETVKDIPMGTVMYPNGNTQELRDKIANANAIWTGEIKATTNVKTGYHIAFKRRVGLFPVYSYTAEYPGLCIHGQNIEKDRLSTYLGMNRTKEDVTSDKSTNIGTPTTFRGESCRQRYNTGWIAVCADCGQKVPAFLYCEKDKMNSVKELTSGVTHFYVCPRTTSEGKVCHSLEQGVALYHNCTYTFANMYEIQYDNNESQYKYVKTRVLGQTPTTYHTYDMSTNYNGEYNNRLSLAIADPTNHITREGYVFDSWNTKPDGTGTKYTKNQVIREPLTSKDCNIDGEEGVVTLYAQWKPLKGTLTLRTSAGETVTTYTYGQSVRINNDTGSTSVTVTYNGNGGTSEKANDTVISTFDGWDFSSTPSNGKAGAFEGENSLYTNYASTDVLAARYLETTCILPGAKRDGYTFAGWWSQASGGDFYGDAGATIRPTSNMTLYAHWNTTAFAIFALPKFDTPHPGGFVNAGYNATGFYFTSLKRLATAQVAGAVLDTSQLIIDGSSTTVSYHTDGSFTFEYDGIYTITLAGGQGANYDSNTGGKAGTVQFKRFFNAGDVITFKVGTQNSNKSSKGGTYSEVAIDGTYVRAGGGGAAAPTGNGGNGNNSASSSFDGGDVTYPAASTHIHHSHALSGCTYRSSTQNTIYVTNPPPYNPTYCNDPNCWNYGGKSSAEYYWACTECGWTGYSTDVNCPHGHNRTKINEPVHTHNVVSGWSCGIDYDCSYHVHDGDTENGGACYTGGTHQCGDTNIHQVDEGPCSNWWDSNSGHQCSGWNCHEIVPPGGWCIRCHSTNRNTHHYHNECSHGHTTYSSTKCDYWYTGVYELSCEYKDRTTVEYAGKKNGSPYTYSVVWLCDGGKVPGTEIPGVGGKNGSTMTNVISLINGVSSDMGNGSIKIEGTSPGLRRDNSLNINDYPATDLAAPNQVPLKLTYNTDSKATITWTNPGDNGSTYTYVGYSYGQDGSGETERARTAATVTSGVKGYYYKFDTSATTTMTASNTFTTELKYGQFSLNFSGTKYFHIAAVDYGGNIGVTSHIAVKGNTDKWVNVNYVPKGGTFQSNGAGTYVSGGATATLKVKYKYGTQYGELPIVTKTGYRFVGWQDSSDTTLYASPTTKAISAKTYNAIWEALRLRLLFNPTIGIIENDGPSSVEVIYNSTQNNRVNKAYAEGYTFTGWYSLPTGGFKVFDNTGKFVACDYWNSSGKWIWTATRIVTVYARYEANTYYVDYYKGNTDDTTTTMSASSHKYNSDVTLSANLFKGMAYQVKFNGNKPAGASTTVSGVPATISGNLKFLEWEVEATHNSGNYAASLNLGKINFEHTNNARAKATAIWENDFVTWTNPTLKGYTFKGWYFNSVCSEEQRVYTPSAEDETLINNSLRIRQNTSKYSVTIYAKWEPNVYTVRYIKNKPEIASFNVVGSTPDSTHTFDVAKNLTKNGYSLVGWKFTGWNTKADGSGIAYSDEQSVINLTNKNGAVVKLYAQWEQVPTNYTVRHWFQYVDAESDAENSTNFELKYTQKFIALSDTYVTPDVMGPFDEFITPAVKTVKVLGDESTVIDYYYHRHKVIFRIDGEYLDQFYDKLNGLCTFDLYINGKKVADDIMDYYSESVLYGSTWEIKDIKPATNREYNGNKINNW